VAAEKMARVNLTDRSVAGANAQDGKRLELWDEKEPGLCLRVSGSAKVWYFRYRTPDGRQPRYKIGTFSDELGVSEARARARKLRTRIDDGEDPAGAKRSVRAKAKAEPIKTFGDLMTAYFAATEAGDWKPKGRVKSGSTIADERLNYRVHIEPVWKAEPLDGITRPKVRALLRDLRAKGLTTRVNRAHALIRQAFSYAIHEDRLQANPALGLPPLVVEKARQRVLTDSELARLWRGLTSGEPLFVTGRDGQPQRVYLARPMAIMHQLGAILLQRRSEIAGMAVSELDLERATWLIPAERMKGRRPHMVALPPYAVTLIGEALKLRSTDNGPCVFPGQRDPETPMNGNSLTQSFRDVSAAAGIARATFHDLRRTGATMLTSERLGVSPFIRSQILGHSDAGGGAAVSLAVYDWNTYLPDKRKALTAWEGLLLEIVAKEA
jgi:integrase